jgi:pimeloyl-ACP methyl ester carboxylesterase
MSSITCAVAPDMRGYGQTEKPEAIDQYTMLHLTGDMAGLVEALGFREAVIVGHDWGAPVAWHSALFRPDKCKGVVGLSVPFRPRLDVAPTTFVPQTNEAIFYQLYFQEPGVAEAELERYPKPTVSMALLGLSGNSISVKGAVGMVARDGGWLDAIAPLVGNLPAEITEDDIDFYVNEYKRTEFRVA